VAQWFIVQQRLRSLLPVPITFAHRGARADARENTIVAFQLALDKGAGGLESDVWLTSDGIPVLDHDGVVSQGPLGRVRKRQIGELRRNELPPHIPSLQDLFDHCGHEYDLSIDLKGVGTGPVVIDLIASAAPSMLPRTWLCDPSYDRIAALRHHSPEIRLVHSTRLQRLTDGPERHAARLAAAGVDGINFHKSDWNGGLVSLFHRFERTAFSWDLQFEHELRPALRMGVDAIYSDFVDRMMAVFVEEIV
jgi:glycerophosphoryl diester phosphodiesterase